MHRIWTKRREIMLNLGSSTGSPGYNHYVRLFMLSGIDIAITIPYNIWYFTMNFQYPLLPWPGWKLIHSSWYEILLFATAELRSNPQLFHLFEISRWICVVYGFLFFLFFGVGAEARTHCMSAWQYISKIFCWRIGSSRESSRYVLELLLFRSIFRRLIDIRHRRSTHLHSVHISFAKNSASDKFDSLGSSYRASDSIVGLSTVASGSSSKQATDSQIAQSRELTKLSPILRQYNITRIPPPTIPSDLESRCGVQPSGLKDSEDRVEL
jgi:Pheromone A receptor